MKCLVCDFGGSSVKYALVDDQARMTHSGKCPAPSSSLAEFLETVHTLCRHFSGQISGIALSLPGMIDGAAGQHHGSGVYGSILAGKNVKALVEEKCGLPVWVENDGKCGALAEAWHGALADVRSGAVLVLGTGIGGGVIIDGHVQRGMNFSAGEFSYALANKDYHLMGLSFMNTGVFGVTYKLCKLKNLDFSVQDAEATLRKFDPLLRDRFPVHTQPPLPIKADGRQFFRWIEEGDPAALQVYGELLSCMAVMVHNIQLCFAPEKIAIGGGLSQAPRLLPDLEDELQRLYKGAGIHPALHARLVRSQYLDECNLLGAMYHFLQQQQEV